MVRVTIGAFAIRGIAIKEVEIGKAGNEDDQQASQQSACSSRRDLNIRLANRRRGDSAASD
jgi:hypothetical protein